MKTCTVMLAVLALLPFPVFAQTSCVVLGQFVHCDSDRGPFDQLQLNRNQGVITDSKGNVEPYAILPARPERSRPLTEAIRPLPDVTRPAYTPYQAYETPTAPVFLYGLGEAGQ